MSEMTTEDAVKAITQARGKMIYHKATGVAFMVIVVFFVQNIINDVPISIFGIWLAGFSVYYVVDKAQKVSWLQKYVRDLLNWLVENS